MTKIIEDVKLDYSDVLLVPKRSRCESRRDVNITRKYTLPYSKRQIVSTGVIAANMDTVGTLALAKAASKYGIATATHKFIDASELASFIIDSEDVNSTLVTIGASDKDVRRLIGVAELIAEEQQVDMSNVEISICIDVSNGYMNSMIDVVSYVRRTFNNALIMAGNVVTADVTHDLLKAGADIVKVGIGSGAFCTTRKLTGVGYPQLSAVMECAEAAHAFGGFICADGGITCAGDVVKAFAAGADFVMIGGLFAGHKESGGDAFTLEGLEIDEEDLPTQPSDQIVMRSYGMSSASAMTKHYGGVASYRAAEGKTCMLPYRGTIEETIKQIQGGIRSACTLIGAEQLKDIPKCATFIRVNRILNNSYSQYDV